MGQRNYSRPFTPRPGGGQQIPQDGDTPAPSTEPPETPTPPPSSSSTSFLCARPLSGHPVPGTSHIPRRYAGDPSRAASRLGLASLPRPPSNSRPSSRFGPTSALSMTPSELPGAFRYRPLSYGQLKEVQRVTRSSPPAIPDSDNEDYPDEPPDGGVLAWAHAFAGFLVCFNTQ